MSPDDAAGLRAELDLERLRQRSHGHDWDVADVLAVLGPWHDLERLKVLLHRDYSARMFALGEWTADDVVLVLALHERGA